MNLAAYIGLRGVSLQADGFTGMYIGLSPVPTFHPPSDKNPIRVKQDMPTDGWHKNDSKSSKKQARKDMVEIVKRLRRQPGKPEVYETTKIASPDPRNLWRP